MQVLDLLRGHKDLGCLQTVAAPSHSLSPTRADIRKIDGPAHDVASHHQGRWLRRISAQDVRQPPNVSQQFRAMSACDGGHLHRSGRPGRLKILYRKVRQFGSDLAYQLIMKIRLPLEAVTSIDYFIKNRVASDLR